MSQGRGGEIKHLYRSYAFLYSKLYLDNGGIFVCKTRHLQLAGGNRESVNITRLSFAVIKIYARQYIFLNTVLFYNFAVTYNKLGFWLYVATNIIAYASRRG